MDSTAQLRSKHLDMQFMRRRRQKNPLGVSRQWFVNAELWLAGTAAAGVGDGQPENQPEVYLLNLHVHKIMMFAAVCVVLYYAESNSGGMACNIAGT